ncbi:(4Fe-4S)-binding protein, partial [candidate division WOR-3 bacterium]
MKKITIVSGKGGTGKTIVTGALVATASLSRRIITVDCDVDAPDLHLILRPQVVKRFEFKGRAKVQIEADDCNRCGKCREVCRFEAINENFVIDQISCEGCLFCYHICPVGAVRTTDHRSGEYFISTTKYGPMVHAQLGVAEENSGRLVTVVRK